MHSFNIKDVTSDNFDYSKLDLSDMDIYAFRKEIHRLWENFSIYMTDEIEIQNEIIENFKFSKNLELAFSLLFVDGLIRKCTQGTFISSCNVDRFVIKVLQELDFFYTTSHNTEFHQLAEKIWNFSPYEICKEFLLRYKSLNSKFLIEEIRKNGFKKIISFKSVDYSYLLDLMNEDDANKFLESKVPAVRIFAYKKIGAYECIDSMLKDKSTLVKEYAASIMDHKDPRFKLLINEKSVPVLEHVLRKCGKEILPLIMANDLVRKNSRIKTMFEQRMSNANNQQDSNI
jgi:hypothetical protein